MNGDDICSKIQEILNNIQEGQGKPQDIEAIRQVMAEWDEYASWGDDR